MSKFKVSYEKDGKAIRLTIANRAGRKWISTSDEGDLGNAAEHAMVLQEWMDGGDRKLNPEGWVEVVAGRKLGSLAELI